MCCAEVKRRDTTELKRSSSRSPVCCQKEPHQRDLFVCYWRKREFASILIWFNNPLTFCAFSKIYAKPTSLWDIINDLSLKQPKCVSHKPFRYFPRFFCFPTCIFEKRRIKKNSEKGAGNESYNTNKSLHVMNFYFNSP